VSSPERYLDRPIQLAGEPVYQLLQELHGQPPTGLTVRRSHFRWRPARGPLSRAEVTQVGGCGVDEERASRGASIPQRRVWAITCRRALEFSGAVWPGGRDRTFL
jgi:hypothetical protein